MTMAAIRIVRPLSWLILLGLVATTIIPADERPVTGLQHDLEHFLAFVIAGLTFAFAHSVYASLRALLLSAIAFTLVLELSQIPLPTRHARVEDFVVDAVAACLGIAIGYAWAKSA